MKLEAVPGYDVERDKDNIGLFNFNSADLERVDTLVIENGILGCSQCIGWAEETAVYLNRNKRVYDPKKVGFIKITGATEYFNLQGYTSFPVAEIREKMDDGKWEGKKLDWGNLGRSPERFFRNVEHQVLGKPLPSDEIKTSNDPRNYQVIYLPTTEAFFANSILSNKRVRSEYSPIKGLVASLDLVGDPLDLILQSPEKLRILTDAVRGRPRSDNEKKDTYYYLIPSDKFNAMNFSEQANFKRDQEKFLKDLEEKRRASLSRSPKALSLFDRAVTTKNAEFEGTAELYIFPQELGEESKKMIRNYFGEREENKFRFIPTVPSFDSSNMLPVNITPEHNKTLRKEAEDRIGFYQDAEEVGAIVLPSNIPKGLLEKVLSGKERAFIFQYRGYDLEASLSYLGTIRELQQTGGDNVCILLERGTRILGLPLKSGESYFIETVVDSPMIFYVEGGKTRFFYSSDSLETYIRNRQPSKKGD